MGGLPIKILKDSLSDKKYQSNNDILSSWRPQHNPCWTLSRFAKAWTSLSSED